MEFLLLGLLACAAGALAGIAAAVLPIAEASAQYDIVVVDSPPILGLADTPLLSSIVFIVVAYFMLMGAVYGRDIGVLRSMKDAVRMMGEALGDMAVDMR